MAYDPAVLNATMEEKAEAFEWLRALAINGGPSWRKAGIAVEEWARLTESKSLPPLMLEAIAVLRELNDICWGVIPNDLQARVDALLDRAEEKR